MEGLMIKPIFEKSVYIPGSKSVWLKLKKVSNQQNANEDTLDLAVIGVYRGKGKRKHVFGSFLLAALDRDADSYIPISK